MRAVLEDLGLNPIVDEVRRQCNEVKSILSQADAEDDLDDAQSRKRDSIVIIQNIKTLIQHTVDESRHNDPRYCSLIADLTINVARILLNSECDDKKYAEEPKSEVDSNVQNHFDEAESLLSILESSRETATTAMFILNELGNFYYKRNDYEKALGYLKKAEALYKLCIEYVDDSIPIFCEFSRLFRTMEITDSHLIEQHYACTNKYMFYLLHDMGSKIEAIEYKFKELNQMSFEKIDVREDDDTNILHWIMQVANLSRFFVKEQCYDQANYCLSVAEKKMDELEESEFGYEYRREIADFRDRILDTTNEVILNFMERSVLRAKGLHFDKGTTEEKKAKLERLKRLKFHKVTDLTIQRILPEEPLTCFQEAREIFVRVHKGLQDRLTYLNFGMQAGTYIECIRNISRAFVCLVGFEPCIERRAKMHKRRVDLFENLKSNLLDMGDDLLSNLVCHDLGDAYGDLLDMKLCQLLDGHKDWEDGQVKVNRLRNLTISNYKQALNFERQYIKNWEKNSRTIRVLTSAYTLAAVYMKSTVKDVNCFIDHAKKALTEYKYVVDYCDANEELKAEMMEFYKTSLKKLTSIKENIETLRKDPEEFDLIKELANLYSSKF